MNIDGRHYYSAWFGNDEMDCIKCIDQTKLPHQFEIESLCTTDEVAEAIKAMHIRGAILIGVMAAYGMVLAALEASKQSDMDRALIITGEKLKATRPTAVNLAWAVDKMIAAISIGESREQKVALAKKEAKLIAESENQACYQIGQYGLEIIKELAQEKKRTINILTHCNAGWLACLDYGTATAPIYAAQDAGLDIHIWVDETRPWNQGSRLTAWELGKHGVPYSVIADNTGGHLMQHGMVDMVIVGSDRTTRTGDVANKIGTYLKALAAFDNQVPFYAAMPSSTIDWTIRNGLAEIPIEQREQEEVKYAQGLLGAKTEKVLITPRDTKAVNYGFDVTPSKYVTGIITERGICEASEVGLLQLYTEFK